MLKYSYIEKGYTWEKLRFRYLGLDFCSAAVCGNGCVEGEEKKPKAATARVTSLRDYFGL